MYCAFRSLPTFERSFAFVTLAVVALSITPRSYAQPNLPRPAFDVASFKLNSACGGRHGRGGGFSPGGYSTSCVPLRVLIRLAYGKAVYGLWNPRPEIAGGPAWLDSELYDIAAKGANVASIDRAFDMLQTLLEDRCKLKIHKETREVPVYSLTVAKGGPKMKATKAGNCAAQNFRNLRPAEPVAGEPNLLPCGYTSTTNGANVTRTGLGVTMDQLACGMLTSLDRPVVNRTGLTGMFDVRLVYAPDPPAATQSSAQEPAGPSIFAAIQQQLGLKLASDKGPVEVFVIDHVEKPSAN